MSDKTFCKSRSNWRLIQNLLVLLVAHGLCSNVIAAPDSPQNLRVVTAFPDATNTGVPSGTVLKSSGNVISSFDGQVIDALDISGTVIIKHNNVTLKRSRITTKDWNAVNCENVTGTVIEDVEVNGLQSGGYGIIGNFTGRRLNVYGFSDGIVPINNSLVEDSYVHLTGGSLDQHADGFPMQGGQSNVTIRHNTIDMTGINGGNGFVFLNGYYGPINNVTIDSNLMLGGGSVAYAAWSNECPSDNPVNNVRYINNVISSGRYGFIYPAGAPCITDIAEWTNNTVYGTGAIIPR